MRMHLHNCLKFQMYIVASLFYIIFLPRKGNFFQDKFFFTFLYQNSQNDVKLPEKRFRKNVRKDLCMCVCVVIVSSAVFDG